MNKLAESVLESFPKVDLSVIVSQGKQEPTLLNDNRLADEFNNWLSWFHSESKAFDFLRIQLLPKADLLFKRTSKSDYLVVLNRAENTTRLINYIKSLPAYSSEASISATETTPYVEPPQASNDGFNEKLESAIKIQKMIIPKETSIQKNFKNFFVVHQQQDVIGGDFYWYKKIGNGAMLALIDCTGHSIEGAMTSMVCNSLLNQVYDDSGADSLENFIVSFYEQLNEYNKTTLDILDYGLGAELGVFHFDYDNRVIKFVSTGISAFLRKDDGLELLKMKKLMDYSKVNEIVEEKVLSMDEVKGLYTFTDGLTDQFDEEDRKKLGYKGVQRMIETESDFSSDYYSSQISEWKGSNMQYDDITLMGLAI